MSALAAFLLALTGTDRLGDPLGFGVTARYGTVRSCRIHASDPDVQVIGRKQGDKWPDTKRATEPPFALHLPDELHSNLPGRRFWRRLGLEPDTDPQPLLKPSPDGRRFIVIQTRQDERADRFRGFPECFVTLYDRDARRVEARYAFRLDDIGTGERLKPSEDGDGGYSFRDFTPSDDGQLLAWVDHLAQLRVRHLPTARVATAPGRYHRPAKVTFGPNNRRLAVLDDDRILRFIDPHTGRFQITSDSPSTAAKQAAVSPDGKLVATGHACGEVWMWDATSNKRLWHTEADGSPVRELHFNLAGTTVSAVGFWGPIGVRTFDAKTGKELGPMLPYRYFRTIAVSADGKRIADLIEEKSIQEKGGWAYPLFVRTREVATGKELNRVRLDHRLGLPNETSGVISRDGRVMVVTHTDGNTFAYDTATGKRLAEFSTPDGGRQSLDWQVGADGQTVTHSVLIELLPGINRLRVDVFALSSLQPGKPVRSIESRYSCWGNTISSDDRYITMAGDGWSCVHDLRTGGEVHDSLSTVAALTPDGKSVLTLPGIRGTERVSLEPLVWKVAPPPKPTEARLKELWKQLGEPAALDAVLELARYPTEAVPFLKAKLLTDPPDAKVVAGHIGKLGSKLFAERDAATKSLRALGPEVLPALRAALKADPSPEARSRIEKLLPVLADTAAPFTLSRLRATETLERCGTPDARAVLKLVAARPGTPWADDAAWAFERLRR